MAEAIIDGLGSGYLVKVDNNNRMWVQTEGISVGSLSVSAGSEMWIKGGSVSVYDMVAGSIVYMPAVSVTTGSESWIKGGSISVYNMVAGSIVYMPSVSVTAGSEQWIMNWTEIGSSVVVTNLYAGSGVWQGTSPWIVGGSVYVAEGVPTSTIYQNPVTVLQYSGTVIGSVWKLNLTGSSVKVLTYTGNNLTNVGSWTAV